MFFFIGGIQPRTVRLEKRPEACPFCFHLDVYLKRTDQYISVFFIPIIRIKKGVPFLTCENCRAVLDRDDGFIGMDRGGDRIRRCGSCGRSVEPDFDYCPYCGKHL